MKEGQFSLTALAAAYIRGYHATHDTPKIFLFLEDGSEKYTLPHRILSGSRLLET